MTPQAHEAHHDEQARRIHGHEGDQRTEVRGHGRARDGERAEIDCEVEVGAWKGLDDGEAEEEVPRGHPARGDDVFAEEGDDDGPAAEDYGAGEVEGGEEGEGPCGGVGEGVEEGGDEEGGEEEDDYGGADFPAHGGEFARWGFGAGLAGGVG